MAAIPAAAKHAALAVSALLVVAVAWTYGSGLKASTQVEAPAVKVQVQPKLLTTQTVAAANPASDSELSAKVQTLPLAAPIEVTAAAAGTVQAFDALDPDITLLRGRALILPVQGVSDKELTDTYTQARAAGAPHEALDIMAARGTPVLAVEDGKLAKLFLSKAGGITIYQFDPTGHYAYYYAHLDRYAEAITEGASVKKGQLIGYVGSTGNASPDAPHLHFAVFKLGPERLWWRGTAVNPYDIWRNQK